MEWALTDAWLPANMGLRDLLRLVLLSGLSTALCLLVYPQNAPTRRLFMLFAVGALVAMPLLVAESGAWLLLPVEDVPSWSLDQAVPVGLIWLWLGVAVALMLGRVWRTLRVQRGLLRQPKLRHQRIEVALHTLCQEMAIERLPELRRGTGKAPGPSSGSLFAPLLVLPDDADHWSANTLRAVLCHELVHLKRRDDLWLLLVGLVCDLYWWMPWLRALYGALLRAVEESCDDEAAEQFSAAVGYLDGVFDVVQREHGERADERPLARLEHHHLVDRVVRFASARDQEFDSRGTYWMLLMTLVLVIGLTGVEPVAQPLPTLEPVSRTEVLSRREFVASHLPPRRNVPQVTRRVYRVDGRSVPAGWNAPEEHRGVLPIYPGDALLDGIEGSVELEFYLARDGRVYRPKVVASEPPQVFDAAALTALRKSSFPFSRSVRDQLVTATFAEPQESLVLRSRYRFRMVSADQTY